FLDRYRPGYRRSHFGRFMRTIFEADIERELRLLEEYIIDGGDPSKVGENLIAEALPQDAPYTKFTAATSGARGSTGHFSAGDSPADLPAEPTRILPRNRSIRPDPPLTNATLVQPDDAGEPAPLSELATQILDPSRPRLHELPTGPRVALPEL